MMNKRQSGFTLLEALVAFMILSMVLTVILQIFSTNLRAGKDIEQQSKAMAVARTAIALGSIKKPVSPDQTSGQTGIFKWHLEITPFESPIESESAPETYQLYLIKVSVKWPRGNHNRQIELNTLRLGKI